MSYDLSIGKQVENRFLTAGKAIARDVGNGQFDQVSIKLNAAFFQGGPSTPKSFQQLISIRDPSSNVIIHRKQNVSQNAETRAWENNGTAYNLFEIEKKISFSAVMGILEGIPVIGSAIAIIMALGHLIGMNKAQAHLQRASQEVNPIGARDADVVNKTKEVVDYALKYTMHRNYLDGSLLSIIPFAKPIVRLLQGIKHQQQQLNPVEQPAVNWSYWDSITTNTEHQFEQTLKTRKKLNREALRTKLSQTAAASQATA